MPKAIWNNQILANSNNTVIIEGNHYFPQTAIEPRFFRASDTETVCGWKGTANYYHIQVGDKTNADAAWYYAAPKPDAENIRDHVAFWKGVEVVD